MTVPTQNETPPAAGPPAGVLPPAPPGYDLLDAVGHGGMGVVYRARDTSLDREVAVKLLQDRFAPDSATARRFVDEARITGQLQHPGIPAVYQVGTLPDGRPFLAMKLIKGDTLDAIVKARSPLDPLAVFEAVARAVGYAHAHGVIHRDLKPQNVMVGAFGEVQVMDWGLAKLLTLSRESRPSGTTDPHATAAATEIRPTRDSDTPFTQYGSMLGTPAYMPPEQAAGELDKVDARSDVFGLGAVLCVLLTGHPPYDGESAEVIRVAALRGKTEPAFARLDGCGADLDAVALCKRCLAFEPADRPADGTAVADAVAALRAAADERARQAERDWHAAEVRLTEGRKRRRAVLVAAGCLVGLLTAAVVGTSWGLVQARRAADAEADARRKADDAQVERTAQLARLAATAAELAARRGAWAEAVRQYDAAIEYGTTDPIGMRVGRATARTALGEFRPAKAELDELAAVDAGPHQGRVLLLQAEYAMMFGTAQSTPPEEYARQAVAAGLAPADACFARMFDACTVPDALDHLRAALRHDPDHRLALRYTAYLTAITGHRAEARRAADRFGALHRQSFEFAVMQLLMAALDGDRGRMADAMDALTAAGGRQVVPVIRTAAEFLADLQDENVLITGIDPARLTELMSVMPKYTAFAKAVGGELGPAAGMSMLRLPMFRAMGEAPGLRALTDPVAALGMFINPNSRAATAAAITKAMPDGVFHYVHATALEAAGRLTEADAAFRRAASAPSLANHRKACLYRGLLVRWRLAASGPPADRAGWRQAVQTDLRTAAGMGNWPAGPAANLSDTARYAGEPEMSLAFADAGLATTPHNARLQAARVQALAATGSDDRAGRAGLALLHADLRPIVAAVAGAPVIGPEEPLSDRDIRDLLNSLSQVIRRAIKSDPKRAVALADAVLRQCERRWPATDDRVLWGRYDLMVAHAAGPTPEKTLAAADAFLAAVRASAGQSARLAENLLDTSRLLIDAGLHADAVPYLRECLSRLSADPADRLARQDRANAQRLLGLAYWRTGRRDRAAELLSAAYPDLVAANAATEAGQSMYSYQVVRREDLGHVVRLLIEYHTTAGRPEEAAAWAGRLPREQAPSPRRGRS